MPEPTIDEMLEWLGRFETGARERGLAVDALDIGNVQAMRAILEQHRDEQQHSDNHRQWVESVIVRAFVKRVDKAFDEAKDTVPEDYAAFVDQELQAMEKEHTQ